jgi:hypothetical protein
MTAAAPAFKSDLRERSGMGLLLLRRILPAGSLQNVNAYLLPALNLGPIAIQRLIMAIGAGEYDTALEEGRFTPREIVAHLADWEPIMRERIRSAVTSPGSQIAAYDEGQMAVDNNYAQSDIFQQAGIFRDERQKTAEYVASLSAEDMKKAVTHPERGTQSAEDLANMLLGHDMYHVEQLSAYLGERVVPTW